MIAFLLAYQLVSTDTFRLQAEDPETVTRSFRLRAEDPDALYKQREDLAVAQRAERIWSERIAKDPKDCESAWKLARARHWLGGHAEEHARKAFLESGITAGRAAIARAPNRPEGHFWVAANMGALAESFGLRQGLKYRGDIKDELETVLRLDAAYQQGSADRALGRWYFKVPGLFGGSSQRGSCWPSCASCGSRRRSHAELAEEPSAERHSGKFLTLRARLLCGLRVRSSVTSD
jgi:hypothetical protein